jgi:hypothetical protein
MGVAEVSGLLWCYAVPTGKLIHTTWRNIAEDWSLLNAILLCRIYQAVQTCLCSRFHQEQSQCVAQVYLIWPFASLQLAPDTLDCKSLAK